MFNLRKETMKKGFVTIIILIMSVFFVMVVIAMNNFNSQIKYSNERNLLEKQIYYNAYAGVQRGIYEIKNNKEASIADYFSIDENYSNLSPKSQDNYTFFKITHEKSGDLYKYTIVSTGYGKYKESIIEQTIEAKITVDYVEKNGIIRIDSMNIQ